ncbi:Syntaxin-16 [Quaeritorhiza haematococci]|nr:Syntaxin-16 [Quaeritorhiza haematococci]
MFQDCQLKIKRIHREGMQSSGKQAQALNKNIQISLATKLQELSSTFRKTQSKYLQKLRGRESRSNNLFSSSGAENAEAEDDELDSVFTDAQLQVVADNERVISEREKNINEIVKSIHGLAEIFKELQTMVIDQGTVLDRIDYNIEMVHVHTESAYKELEKVSGKK